MLAKFVAAKQKEIDELRRLADAGRLPSPLTREIGAFSRALRSRREPLPVIAEYKRASPSIGPIREDLSPEEVAAQYAAGGASALSILTETDYFRGDFDYLRRAAEAAPLPILRKDFLFDPIQIDATAASPASALLLIVRLTPLAELLRNLRERAKSYGIEAVVEIFDDEDLKIARDSGAKIIQVNARDLQSLRVDRRECLKMIKRNKPLSHETWIAASGVSQREHLREAADAGYAAALVGSALMKTGSPGENLKKLLAP